MTELKIPDAPREGLLMAAAGEYPPVLFVTSDWTSVGLSPESMHALTRTDTYNLFRSLLKARVEGKDHVTYQELHAAIWPTSEFDEDRVKRAIRMGRRYVLDERKRCALEAIRGVGYRIYELTEIRVLD